MTTTTLTEKSRGVRVVGLLTLIAGIIFLVAGGVTWGTVASNLANEQITVSDDARAFGGQLVDTPWEAWAQADIINTHALKISGGKTYAELPQDDPKRDTVMTASFLRASLFTSVVAFGVAALVVGLGIVFILVGWAIRHLGAAHPVVDSGPAPVVAPAVATRPVAPAAPPVAAAPVVPTTPPAPPAPPTAPPAPPVA